MAALMLSGYLLVPVGFLIAVGYLMIKQRRLREGLIALGLFALAVATGFWAIMQSRSSTAGIGVIFLPFFGALAGGMGLVFTSVKSRARWLALAAALAICGYQLYEGRQQIARNAQRDLEHQKMQELLTSHRQEIKSLLAERPGNEAEALRKLIDQHPDDRTYLIPILESEHVDAQTLERLSRNADLGVAWTVARHPKAPVAVLEYFYRSHPNGDYFVQSLASNPSTPPELLRSIWKERRLGGQAIWLKKNPNTPADVLSEIAKEGE